MINGQRVESPVGVIGRGGRLEFIQTIGNEENAVNEDPIGRSLNFKVSKEGVCPE